MPKKPLRSQKSYGKHDRDGFIHRSWIKATGLPDHVFDGRPIIGIANTWSELVTCQVHLRELAGFVKRGIWEAGGVPIEFPAMSLPETQMAGTVAAYYSIGSEPETHGLLFALWKRGTYVLLPILLPDGDLDWASYEGPDSLRPGPRWLTEPAEPPRGAGAISSADLVLVPALAVDHSGVRLGRGDVGADLGAGGLAGLELGDRLSLSLGGGAQAQLSSGPTAGRSSAPTGPRRRAWCARRPAGSRGARARTPASRPRRCSCVRGPGRASRRRPASTAA